MVLRPRNGISLCSGGGGLELGLQIAEPDFACRCFVESDADAQAVLMAGMAPNALDRLAREVAVGRGADDPHASTWLSANTGRHARPFHEAAVWSDVRTFVATGWRGYIDLISAGYPCQPFSAAGKRGGSDDPRHLWPDVLRIWVESGAEWGFFENVAGHISLGLESVLRDIWDVGGTPAVGLFSSGETGNSHERQRVFIVAHRQGADRRRELTEAIEGRGRAGSSGSGGELENAANSLVGIHTGSGQEGIGAADAGRPIGDVGDTDADADARGMVSGADRRTPRESSRRGKERERLRDRIGRASNNVGNPARVGRGEGRPEPEFRSGGTPLPAQTANWTTPQAHDVTMRGSGQKPTAKAGNACLARRDAANWPTPASRDHKGENADAHLTNGTGRLHLDQLPNAVAHCFTRPDPETTLHGVPSSQWRPVSRRLLRSATSSVAQTTLRRWLRKGAWKKRRLNPIFVEWLMRWPSGHGLCECSETEWTQWLQHMRGALSAQPLASGPWIWKPPVEATPEPEQLSLL